LFVSSLQASFLFAFGLTVLIIWNRKSEPNYYIRDFNLQQMPFPVIDLFAGPGGLAEGFSSLADQHGERIFDIRLSIEKDPHAHQTLKLRSFVRQFAIGQLPEDYYHLISGRININELYENHPIEHAQAANEAWMATLGETPEAEIDRRIQAQLNGRQDWLLIGGPPCQAYSLVGRSRVGGISPGDKRVHLYKEYLRIIARFQPSVFVMENVKGLLSAQVEGEKIFDKIMDDLRNPSSIFPEFLSQGYRIYSLVSENVTRDSDYLIRAEVYGVPQRRHRVILLGVRDDVNVQPGTLIPAERVSLSSVIGSLPAVRSGIYREFVSSKAVIEDEVTKKKRSYRPLTDSAEGWLAHVQKYAGELKENFSGKGITFKFQPTAANSVGQEYMPNDNFTVHTEHPLREWFTDPRVQGVLHHTSRGHLTLDLKRYLFAALYTQAYGTFPRMADYKAFGDDLLPDHKNAESGKFNDRFRVQLPNEPATTVTSHISKDGHYFIHYDPSQCRSLTVREAARIQTFPDNYYFCGSRTQQFHQVGNAVPPYLAYQIAEIVYGVLVPQELLVEEIIDNQLL
jgi:DNA (cytosine-5)-methyltransferase 1